MVRGKISVIGHGPVYDREVLSEIIEEMFVTCFYWALNDLEGSYGDDHEGRGVKAEERGTFICIYNKETTAQLQRL